MQKGLQTKVFGREILSSPTRHTNRRPSNASNRLTLEYGREDGLILPFHSTLPSDLFDLLWDRCHAREFQITIVPNPPAC